MLKRLVFVSLLFVHENQSQESLSTRRVPWGQKRVKNDDRLSIPPIRKNSIFGLRTNIHRKAAKRISVSENLLWDNFWNSHNKPEPLSNQRKSWASS